MPSKLVVNITEGTEEYVELTAEEIAEQRDLGLTSQDVYLERKTLSLP